MDTDVEREIRELCHAAVRGQHVDNKRIGVLFKKHPKLWEKISREEKAKAIAELNPMADRTYSMTLADWMKSAEYLPAFMRDFHAQKRVFKRIDEGITPEHRARFTYIDWIAAHIYVVDSFLWFMARHGYTLQKSRKQVEFIDLEQDLSAFDQRQLEQFSA